MSLFGALLFQSVLPLAQPQLGNPQVIAIAAGTTADFDLDGVPDLAIANGFLQSIGGPFRRLAVDGQGQLQTLESGPFSLQYPLALYKACAGGDVDGDRLPDLITGNSEGAIELFLNGGPAQMRLSGSPLRSPVVLESLAATMNISGPRTFTFPVFLLTDLDQDGHLDLVLAGHVMRLFQATTSTDLRVWFGDAQGQFRTRALASLPLAVAARAGDFDGDGVQELAVAALDGALYVYSTLGQQLTLLRRQILPVPWQVSAMDLGDVTGDGRPDYVFAGDPGTGAVLYVTGAPGGALLQSQALPLPPGPSPCEIPSVRVLDMDSDGARDVVALQTFGAAAPARLVYWHALGGGVFDTPGVMVLPGTVNFLFQNGGTPTPLPDLLAATDLNRDGNPELILGMLQTQPGAPAAVALLRNTWVPHCLVDHHGIGATGSGDFRPRIGALGGLPLRGQADFAITLTDAVGGGAWASLLIGTTPVDLQVGNELWFYTVPRFASIHATVGQGPGGGHVVMPCPIPDDPNVVGLTCWFQWAIADIGPGRTLPVTTSDALQVIVGSRF